MSAFDLIGYLKAQARKYGCVRVTAKGSGVYAQCFSGSRVTFKVDGRVRRAEYVREHFTQ